MGEWANIRSYELFIFLSDYSPAKTHHRHHHHHQPVTSLVGSRVGPKVLLIFLNIQILNSSSEFRSWGLNIRALETRKDVGPAPDLVVDCVC